MMKYLFILCFLCSIHASARQITVVNNSKNKDAVVNLLYADASAKFGHPISSLKGTYTISSELPVLFYESSGRQTCYLAYPGDTLLFNMDAKVPVVSRASKSLKDPSANELLFFDALITATEKLTNAFDCPPDYKISDLDKRELKITERYNSRLKFLENYRIEHPVSDGFSSFCKSMFSALLVKDILWLCKTPDIAKKLQERNLSRKDSMIGLLIPDQNSYRFNKEYNDALNALATLVTGVTDYKDFNRYSTSINKNFRGDNAEFLLASKLISILMLDPIPPATAKAYFTFYNETAKNIYFKAGVESVYKDFLNKNEAIKATGTSLTNVKTGNTVQWTALLNQYKGRVIYVDFWASWCAPCVAEMPRSRALQQFYKDKPITFLYLSMDEQRDDWKNGSSANLLPSANSYLVDGGFKSKLASGIKLTTIPRYMIIGKNGKVVTDDALRPGDQALKKILTDLLK